MNEWMLCLVERITKLEVLCYVKQYLRMILHFHLRHQLGLHNRADSAALVTKRYLYIIIF